MKNNEDKMKFILDRIKEYMNTYDCTIENAISWSLSDWNHNDYQLDLDDVDLEKTSKSNVDLEKTSDFKKLVKGLVRVFLRIKFKNWRKNNG